ncbi:MAG: tRNA (adenosine(37)-N6)-threonylcarbamoyltransferase complex dimerization subunit type 1 TsaB [Capsulimonadaceae bacterium]
MPYLILDTSADHAVLVLAGREGAVAAATVYEGRRSLSRRLMGVLDRLLCENGLGLEDVDGLAVGVGPGSFTGLRVGLTTMKTLAQATALPLAGIPTLAAYAHGVRGAEVVVATPSRRDEAYVAVYSCDAAGSPAPVKMPYAATYASLAEDVWRMAAERQVALCGPAPLLDALGRYGSDSAASVRIERAWPPPAGLAALAASRLSAGDVDDPLGLVPTYVVPPAISTPRLPAHLPGGPTDSSL